MTRASARAWPPVALALALAPFSAVAASELAANAEEVLRHVEDWDVEGARKLVDELLVRDPASTGLKALDARVRFEEGDYAKAVQLLDEAGAGGEDGWPAIARATLKETKGYESRKSDHFVFSARPGKDQVLASYGLEALEKERAALEKALGYAPPGRVRVEVLDDARALSRLSSLSVEAIKTSGTIAICKFDKLMITSPKALLRGYDWLETLSHEYVHLVVSRMSRNGVPIWIHEGVAKFYESLFKGAPGLDLSPASAALLAEASKKGKLISFERMHPSMALLPSQEDAALAFAEVFTAIEWMHQKGGDQLVRRLIRELASEARHDAAVSRTLGMPFAAFEAEWKSFLSKRDFPKETLPLSAEKLKFKEDQARDEKRGAKPGEKGDEIRFGDFLEIADLEARKLAHLGELLRTRGRTRAAVEEFGKAHTRVGNRSPALSNRFAEALVKLGDLSRAEELLTASLKPFPGYSRTQANLADLYVATQRPQKAELAFLEVVGTDPFDPAPHAGLLRIYTDRKDEIRALREKTALQMLAGNRGGVPEDGLVVVQSHPYARVFLDGQDTGRTTPAQFLVPAGSHQLKLVNDERAIARDLPLEIAAGEQKTVEVSFEEPPPPQKQR